MIVKVLPKRGTTMHVWDRKKYYPGEIKGVDDELGATLIRKRIAEKIEEPKRKPGRPRKTWGE